MRAVCFTEAARIVEVWSDRSADEASGRRGTWHQRSWDRPNCFSISTCANVKHRQGRNKWWNIHLEVSACERSHRCLLVASSCLPMLRKPGAASTCKCWLLSAMAACSLIIGLFRERPYHHLAPSVVDFYSPDAQSGARNRPWSLLVVCSATLRCTHHLLQSDSLLLMSPAFHSFPNLLSIHRPSSVMDL